MIDHLMYDIIEFFDSSLESGELPEFRSRLCIPLQPDLLEDPKVRHPEVGGPESTHLLSILSVMSSVTGIPDTTTIRNTPKPACPALADANRIRASSSRMTDPRRDVEQQASRTSRRRHDGNRIGIAKDQISADPPSYHEAIGLPHSSQAWSRERVTEASPPSVLPTSSPSRWNPFRSLFKKGRLFESKRRKSTTSSALRVVTMESNTGRTAVAVLPKH